MLKRTIHSSSKIVYGTETCERCGIYAQTYHQFRQITCDQMLAKQVADRLSGTNEFRDLYGRVVIQSQEDGNWKIIEEGELWDNAD
jgi:hypothetical protein